MSLFRLAPGFWAGRSRCRCGAVLCRVSVGVPLSWVSLSERARALWIPQFAIGRAIVLVVDHERFPVIVRRAENVGT